MQSNLCSDLRQIVREEKKLLKRVEKELSRLPDGTLEIGLVKHKYVQFHVVSGEKGNRVRKYLSAKDKLVSQLAQKAYEQKLKRELMKRKRAIEKAVAVLQQTNPAAIYEKESPERKKLIIPLIPTDEQVIEQWYEEHRGAQNSHPMGTSYTTIRGETVRSKSEKMIADTYHLAGVPYVYEPSVILANGRTRNPDFAVLNVRTRKTMYHEHFGMMDDDEYRQRAILKTREYNRSGYRAGDVMIYTYEGEGIPFDQDELEELIRAFLV